MGDVDRQANSFVGTLAQLQDSEKIRKSNEQAAREALARLAKAKEEEAEVRTRTQGRLDEVERIWRETAAKIEAGEKRVVELREQAQREYDARVSEAVQQATEAANEIRNETKALIVERDQRKQDVMQIDRTVLEHQKVLDAVRKEMAHLALRLTS